MGTIIAIFDINGDVVSGRLWMGFVQMIDDIEDAEYWVDPLYGATYFVSPFNAYEGQTIEWPF